VRKREATGGRASGRAQRGGGRGEERKSSEIEETDSTESVGLSGVGKDTKDSDDDGGGVVKEEEEDEILGKFQLVDAEGGKGRRVEGRRDSGAELTFVV
jgi:hypothetical protein